jgi:ligand-binding SRPBCC domain-containing protein
MTMFVLRASTLIQAPIERCFALSTSIEIVRLELGMTPVAGGTSGCVRAGDIIRWEGRQLGLWHYHVSLISIFDPPRFFQDRMIAGRFRTFEHDHHFEQTSAGVLLRDELRFSLPFGPLGWLVGRFILQPHIQRLMALRFQLLKTFAEGEGWREWLDPPKPNP